jgi:hypothetical protein
LPKIFIVSIEIIDGKEVLKKEPAPADFFGVDIPLE